MDLLRRLRHTRVMIGSYNFFYADIIYDALYIYFADCVTLRVTFDYYDTVTIAKDFVDSIDSG